MIIIMQKQTYRGQPSPYQIMRKRALDVSDEKHPVREELRRHYGTYNFTATFEEDVDTARAFKHISEYLPVICTLRKDGKVIAIGRGASVLSPMNRSIQRAVYGAINGSWLSASNNACKVFDLERMDVVSDKPGIAMEPVLATEKQRAWLRELILLNCEDDTDRQQRIEALDTLTKDEASQQIQMLAR